MKETWLRIIEELLLSTVIKRVKNKHLSAGTVHFFVDSFILIAVGVVAL